MAAEESAEYKASENKRPSELRRKEKAKMTEEELRLFTSGLFKKSC